MRYFGKASKDRKTVSYNDIVVSEYLSFKTFFPTRLVKYVLMIGNEWMSLGVEYEQYVRIQMLIYPYSVLKKSQTWKGEQ